MRIVVALGGNALLERGEKPDSQIQLHHIHAAVAALAPIATDNEVVVTHGNGPQVGLLALESAGDRLALRPLPVRRPGRRDAGHDRILAVAGSAERTPRPVCRGAHHADARVRRRSGVRQSDQVRRARLRRGRSETTCGRRGLDGQARRALLASSRAVAAASRHRGDRAHPSALRRGCRGRLRRGRRRAGHPQRSGPARRGGGRRRQGRDRRSSRRSPRCRRATRFSPTSRPSRPTTARRRHGRSRRPRPPSCRAHPFPPGSMGPKVEAVCRFAEMPGRFAAIGALGDAEAILAGTAGTIVTPDGAYP